MIISVFKRVSVRKSWDPVEVAKEVGECPYHAFRDSLIAILTPNDESSITRVLDAFSRKELRSFPDPEESHSWGVR